MSLREKAVKGIAWSATEKWGQQAIQFLTFLVLARLLEAEAFGLVALASVFTAFFQIFLDQGLAEALVQRADLAQEHLDTAFWTNILTAGLLTMSGILLSRLAANFFNEPRLAPIVAWLSLSFLLSALSSTQQAILRRRLDFKSLAMRTLVARISGGVVGVGAALLGFGVWSLVAQSLVNSLVVVLVLWQISDWRPSLRFSRKHFAELFTFGLNVVGYKLLIFFSTRFDDFLIGYFLGPIALGYYTIAYRLLRIMNDLLSNVTSSVAFPTFSRLQTEPEQLRHAFYEAVKLTSLIAFPVFLGMAVTTPELVMVLFGAKWVPSIPVMQILAFVGLRQSIFQSNGDLILAMGKPAWILGLLLLNTTVNVVGFLLVVQWGIVAVAAVFAFTRYGFAPLYLWVVHRLINLDFRVYFSQYTVPLISSLVMVATILGLKYVLDSWEGYWQLVIYTLAGGVVYLGGVQLMQPSLSRQLLDLVRLVLPQFRLKNG